MPPTRQGTTATHTLTYKHGVVVHFQAGFCFMSGSQASPVLRGSPVLRSADVFSGDGELPRVVGVASVSRRRRFTMAVCSPSSSSGELIGKSARSKSSSRFLSILSTSEIRGKRSIRTMSTVSSPKHR
eukprot:Gregarina_sp_Pseudo_9__3278@NODE_345_length_3098_cov_31_728669_g325_i0_p5_GENE_NODE_345_length_3098_cov_31_728669_g325_i0NODE_345_length_3098_cov_31_728669_g325_i0_p5_ORF_typecomplete_len128_score16_04_NODE_345_length_3098_cov_31_728669_g325_i09111294